MAIRIGLAHGPVVEFSSTQTANNLIAVDRAKTAKLSYLALGDWHGRRQIDAYTHYCGTPEPDDFGREVTGMALLVDVSQKAEAARIELDEFGSILDALESNRNNLRRLNRDLNDPEREVKLKQLNEDIQGAQVAHSALQLSELKLKEATGAHHALEKRATRRATLQTELEAARKRLSGQEITARESIEAVDRARTSAAEANAALDAARLVAVQTASARQAAEARRGEIRHAKSLAIAFDRLDAAELLAKEIGIVATTLAQNKISKEAIDALESADRKIQTLKVKAAAGAVHLSMLFEIGAPEIRVNGVVVSPSYEALFADEQTVELAGLGKITIEPPQGGESAILALNAAESDMSVDYHLKLTQVSHREVTHL